MNTAPPPNRAIAPVIGLLFLAPFVGELLLGNITLEWIALFPLLIPLYGGGAVLIREIARRTGGGWPTMALLATAYALIEEGPVDQLLWNDSYAGQDMLTGPSYLPSLGMSVELTQTVIALHAVWSICVPIALVEGITRRRETPWLGNTGLGVIAGVYLCGAVLVFFGNYAEEQFLASPAQQLWLAVVIIALLIAAIRIRTHRLPRLDGDAPHPAMITGFGLVATSAYWAPLVLITADWWEWIGVAVWCAVAAIGIALVSRWSRRAGWGAAHRFALASGATLTYVWTAFPLEPEAEASPTLDLIGNTVCGAIAVAILLVGWRRLRGTETSS